MVLLRRVERRSARYELAASPLMLQEPLLDGIGIPPRILDFSHDFKQPDPQYISGSSGFEGGGPELRDLRGRLDLLCLGSAEGFPAG